MFYLKESNNERKRKRNLYSDQEKMKGKNKYYWELDYYQSTILRRLLIKGNTKFWEILKIGWIVILYNFDIF